MVDTSRVFGDVRRMMNSPKPNLFLSDILAVDGCSDLDFGDKESLVTYVSDFRERIIDFTVESSQVRESNGAEFLSLANKLIISSEEDLRYILDRLSLLGNIETLVFSNIENSIDYKKWGEVIAACQKLNTLQLKGDHIRIPNTVNLEALNDCIGESVITSFLSDFCYLEPYAYSRSTFFENLKSINLGWVNYQDLDHLLGYAVNGNNLEEVSYRSQSHPCPVLLKYFENNLLTKVSFGGWIENLDDVSVAGLFSSPNLVSLRCPYGSQFVEFIQGYDFSRLSELSFKNLTGLRNIESSVLASKSMPNLTRLDLSDCVLQNYYIYLIGLSKADWLDNLVSLDLSDNQARNDEDEENLVTFFRSKNWDSLKHLNLAGCGLNEKIFRELIEMDFMERLYVLNLSGAFHVEDNKKRLDELALKYGVKVML